MIKVLNVPIRSPRFRTLLLVSFNELTRDAILEFAEKNSDLLEGSKIGKELLDLCRQ